MRNRCWCCLLPPHITEALSKRANSSGSALLTHINTQGIRANRTLLSAKKPTIEDVKLEKATINRRIYSAEGSELLPGQLVWKEGDPAPKQIQVKEVAEHQQIIFDCLREVFDFSGIDGRGSTAIAIVNYGDGYVNACWNGAALLYGNGNGQEFGRFTSSLSVTAHETGHGIQESRNSLGYLGQNGAINEHLSDVIAVVVDQWSQNQTVSEGTWLVGAEIFNPWMRSLEVRAVRDFANPGFAYDSEILGGRDPQVAHMNMLYTGSRDGGGLHINSGILNLAFFNSAIELGGYIWESGVAHVWWQAMQGLSEEVKFKDFAEKLRSIAQSRNKLVNKAVSDGLKDVGL